MSSTRSIIITAYISMDYIEYMACPSHPHTASGHWRNGAMGCDICYRSSEARISSVTESIMANGKQAFENTSTSVAASQMRNALNNLSDSVKDPAEKQVSPHNVSYS